MNLDVKKATYSFSVSALVFYMFLQSCICDESTESPECAAWSSVESKLKNNNEYVKCIKNPECTGVNCSVTISGNYNFHAGMRINPCATPVSVDLYANIPNLGMSNWKKTFTHGDNFNISGTQIGIPHGLIQGELQLDHEGKTLVVGLRVRTYIFYPSSNLEWPSFQNLSIPIPPCDKKLLKPLAPDVSENKVEATTASSKSPSLSTSESKTEKVTSLPDSFHLSLLHGGCVLENSSVTPCSLKKLNSCQENEICLQNSSHSSNGVCCCLDGYNRNKKGKCISKPSSGDSSSVNVSLILTATLVPLLVISLLGALIYVARVLKVFQMLRRRFQVQAYEQVLLSQDEEEELGDPVA